MRTRYLIGTQGAPVTGATRHPVGIVLTCPFGELHREMNDQDDDKTAEERIADALERRNRLTEDRNAILKEGFEALLWAMYDEEGRQNPDGRAPDLTVEDSLFELNYLRLMGGRRDGRPEEDDEI